MILCDCFVNVVNKLLRYPERTREELENACPFCCGNCNCIACLRGDVVVKVCCSYYVVFSIFT